MIVNSTARSYYKELLQQGVNIFEYKKGFVHSKVMIIDDNLAIVGSANMDYRSFGLNFEANAMLYSIAIVQQLQAAFDNDIQHSSEINATDWINRPKYIHLYEKIVGLLAPIF